MDEPLSDEYSIWGYRLFLDREPESEQTIKNRTGVFKNTQLLRQHFLSSEEYCLKNRDSARFYYLGLLPKMDVSTSLKDEEKVKLTKHVQKTWEDLGEVDAHWSVLSSDNYRNDLIEENQEDFNQSAKTDMLILEATLKRNGIDISEFRSCREFGCGVGRVTRFLAERFEQVEGIDISRKHLDIASQSIDAAGLEHVTFKHIISPDELGKLTRTDFVFSVMVLQHNPPPIMALIFSNLLARLNPGGIAFIQIPTYRHNYSFEVQSYIDTPPFAEDELEMHFLPQSEVFKIIDQSNCLTVEVIEDEYIGRNHNMLSNTFLVRKKE